MSLQLILAVLSPLVFLVPRRAKAWYVMALVCTGAVTALTAAVRCLAHGVFSSGEPLQWHYRTLFGMEYASIDALSAVFVAIISVAAIAVTLYMRGYMARYEAERAPAHLSLHYMCLALLFFSMLGVVTFRGGYGFLFCWELMTICSFLLIAFDAHRKETRKAALNYLIMMHVGFVFLLSGFITMQARGLSADFDSLGAYFNIYPPMPLFLLFLVGFGMKAGLFPLHSWLPEAHPAAPAHVSAFMSGVMIKMGVYGVMRVISCMQSGLLEAGAVLFTVGLATGVWGVLFAAVQNDAKRLLAYSSIENIGIIFMAMGAALAGRAQHNSMLALCAMSGALLHTVNHSHFKTLLFFGAGNIYTQAHTTSLEDLGGLAKRMPATATLMLAGVAAICALPPLSGFVSEFLIYFGFIDTLGSGDRGVIMAVGGMLALAFIGGVAAIAFSKLFGVVFLGEPRSPGASAAAEVDRWRIAACIIPAACVAVVGLAPFVLLPTIFDTAGNVTGIGNAGMIYALIGRDVYTMACVTGIFIIVVAAVMLLRRFALRKRTVASSPTWGCGFGSPSSSMQYSGESFSEGLQSISPQLTDSHRDGNGVNPDEIFPAEHNFSVRRRDRVAALFNAMWVEVLRRLNSRVMAMRTGKVNYYLLYALLFLLLVLVFSILGLI